MTPAYILKDNEGNSGQILSFARGESRVVNVFLFNPDGTPLTFLPTVTEILVKIFSNPSSASIQKLFSTGGVSKLTLSTEDHVPAVTVVGMIGVQFALTSADTANMSSNNTGLPMSIIVTDSAGGTTEYDFVAVFEAQVPAVLT